MSSKIVKTGRYIVSSRYEDDKIFSFINDEFEDAKEKAWKEYSRCAVRTTGCKIILETEKITHEIVGAN